MRQVTTIILALVTGSALSGCAQIGSAADALWSGTKSVGRFVGTPYRKYLRDAPEPEYVFDEAVPADSDVVVYAGAAPSETQPAPVYIAPGPVIPAEYPATGQYYADADPVPTATIASPDSIAFVRLNGESSMQDWQNCEMIHRGYWLIDAAGGRINPDFEVCMRNKGYVRESELAVYGFQGEVPVRSGYSSNYTNLP